MSPSQHLEAASRESASWARRSSCAAPGRSGPGTRLPAVLPSEEHVYRDERREQLTKNLQLYTMMNYKMCYVGEMCVCGGGIKK